MRLIVKTSVARLELWGMFLLISCVSANAAVTIASLNLSNSVEIETLEANPTPAQMPTAEYGFSQSTVNFLFGIGDYENFNFTGYSRYRVFLNTMNTDDFVKRVYGDASRPASVTASGGVYNNNACVGPTSGGVPPIDFWQYAGGYNLHQFDSWVGIGLTEWPVSFVGEADVDIIESAGNEWSQNLTLEYISSGNYGAVDIQLNDNEVMEGWELPLGTESNGFAGDDNQVAVMQITTNGALLWTLNAEIWVHGDSTNKVIVTQSFDGTGLGSVIIEGCTNPSACNYYSLATSDNGSCEFPDAYLDCDDECLNDTDGDGVCNELEIAGCTQALACNFNALATDEDDSCEFPEGCETCSGETNGTGSVVDNDADDDGVCDADEVVGCQNPLACNYNAAATDPAPCTITDGICESCSGATDGSGVIVDNDSDDDGVCDADEIVGCQDSLACNYMTSATDAGACIYPQGCEYCSGETNGSGTALDGDADDDGVCDVDEVAGCQDSTACNFEPSATDSDGSCEYCSCGALTGLSPYSLTVEEHAVDGIPGHTTYRLYVNMEHPNDYLSAIYGEGTENALALTSTSTPNWHNDEIVNVNYGTEIMPIMLGAFPALAYDSWFTFGSDTANADLNIGSIDASGTFWNTFNSGADIMVNDPAGFTLYNTRDCTLPPGDGAGSCDTNHPAVGGEDGRVLIAQITTEGTLSGELSVQILQNGIYGQGVFHTEHFEFNGEGTFSSASWSGAMTSNYQFCGCTDDEALNFDAEALHDDGNCVPVILGCMNADACNYMATATVDDGGCEVPVGCDTCSGEQDGSGTVVDNDSDNDGVCDDDEVVGCQDVSACNYDVAATDEGSCEFATEVCETCSGENNGSGTVVLNDQDGDGVCDADEVVGCQNSAACNFNDQATDAGACVFPEGCESCSGETNGTGVVVDNDEDNDGVCDANEVPGCQDSNACNYNAAATDDGDACIYATGCESCSGETDGSGTVVDNDADDDNVCDTDEVVGCQDAAACNYNSAATDAGSCVYPVETCETCSGDTDGTGIIVDNDSDDDGVCDADEVAGCQNPLACNFNASATDGGVSCLYAIGCNECTGNSNDGTGTVLELDDDNDGVCNIDEIPGCQDAAACNFNVQATDDDGGCVYPAGCQTCSGQTDGSGTVLANDDDGDGVCNADEILGCQDSAACNYHASATDPGSCAYPVGPCDSCSGATDGTGVVVDNDADDDNICDADEIVGCQDSLACNYDELATDPGVCFTAGPYYDCSGDCINDTNNNGVCDEIDNLVSDAASEAYDNGYANGLAGCDGSEFCGEGTIWSSEFQMCIEDSDCPGDLNGDLVVGTGDLLLLLMDYGFGCE